MMAIPPNIEPMFRLDDRSLFFREVLKNMPMIMPRRKVRIDPVFKWESRGHDPRNHHGRFMYPAWPQYTISKHWIIIDEASNWPLGDPRNHFGRHAHV